ncbi:MAG: DUF1569 domain-containing protein [Cyanobacteria bacterium]|nr:DUF1569 domain-containing protein [Cyanobacteriota bacterium]
MIHLTGDEPPVGDLPSALAESRAALQKLVAAGEKCGTSWTTPRAPGKWSPSQIVEHVARVLEESGKTIKGEPSAFPGLPPFLRPLIRGLFFNRILKKNRFINGRTNRALNPIAGPPTPAEGRTRLQRAHDAFERACKDSPPRFVHGVFGDISTTEYARFQALHTLHHAEQVLRS